MDSDIDYSIDLKKMLAILILILAHKPHAANSTLINSPYCTYSFNGDIMRGCRTVGFFVPVEVDEVNEVYEVVRNAPVRLALRG